jgi:hypothetical protein
MSKIDKIVKSKNIDKDFDRARRGIASLFILGVFLLGTKIVLGKMIALNLSLIVFFVLFLYIFNGFRFFVSKTNLSEKEYKYFSIYLFWHLIIYPLDNPTRRQIILPESRNTKWNYKAAIIPELWFLYNEIWGVFLIILAGYMLIVYLCMSEILPQLGMPFLLYAAIIRLIASKKANLIYYFRYGVWPS